MRREDFLKNGSVNEGVVGSADAVGEGTVLFDDVVTGGREDVVGSADAVGEGTVLDDVVTGERDDENTTEEDGSSEKSKKCRTWRMYRKCVLVTGVIKRKTGVFN